MPEAFNQAFADVAFALQADPDDDVTQDGDRLLVRGRVFARLDGGRLVVDLPAARAEDLMSRGVATRGSGDDARGAWVAVEDEADWLELATEAHQFVGEPAVGRDS